jgi:ferredoxin-NADP reductase
MARAAVRGRLSWALGDVVELIDETRRVRSIVLDVPDWPGHRAGQHVDVRLTAEDGYQAQRSYSIASAPDDARLAITVESLPDGEVSSYLVGELRVGDKLELRGPIGGYFVWDPDRTEPLFLVAGGSGVVPLMSMIRERHAIGATVPTKLLFSSRARDDVIYRDELEQLASAGDGFEVIHTLTRMQPDGLRATGRHPDALRGCVAGVGDAGVVRLRTHAVRGGRGERARVARPPGAGDQDRTLRTDGRLRWTTARSWSTGTRSRAS